MSNESTTSTLDDLISPMVAEALFVASETSIMRGLVRNYTMPRNSGKVLQVPIYPTVTAAAVAEATDLGNTAVSTSKADLKQQLRTVESIINSLNPKHKIIYLTYKLYEQVGTYIPKSVREKLQEELELTQSSIRKYKEEAIKEIQAHLKKENG